MTPDIQRTIMQLSKQGATLDTIASATRLSRRTIERARRSLGLTNPKARGGAPLSPDRRAQLDQLIADGASHAEIIRTMHVHGATIRRHHPGSAWDATTAGQLGQLQRRLHQTPSKRGRP